MSFLKALGSIASVAANFIPGGGIVKTALQVGGKIMSKPVVKVAAGAAAGIGGMKLISSAGQQSVGTLPALPGVTTGITTPSAPGGLPIGWKGPNGKLQLPWNDPRTPEFLKQFALDDSYLKTYYRAPKGYVILKDANGRPFPVLKKIAQQYGLWKPSAKPPISATMWKHYKQNKRIEKKLIKIAGPAVRKHSKRTAAPVKHK
jgi:hypothetical protein